MDSLGAGAGHNPVRASHDKGGAAGPGKALARQESGFAGKVGAEAAQARAAPSRSHYELREMPWRLRVVVPPIDKANPKKGIGAPTAAVADGRVSTAWLKHHCPTCEDPCGIVGQVLPKYTAPGQAVLGVFLSTRRRDA